MISQPIKKVMKTCGLTQVRLSELMGVHVSRVKSITAGRVKTLTREELEILVKKLDIRAEWLVTGEGPMFKTSAETAFQRAGRYPRELALFNAIETNLATLGSDPHARAACELAAILLDQCGAYRLALRRIVEIAKKGGMTDRDIFNVTDNLDQPL